MKKQELQNKKISDCKKKIVIKKIDFQKNRKQEISQFAIKVFVMTFVMTFVHQLVLFLILKSITKKPLNESFQIQLQI